MDINFGHDDHSGIGDLPARTENTIFSVNKDQKNNNLNILFYYLHCPQQAFSRNALKVIVIEILNQWPTGY